MSSTWVEQSPGASPGERANYGMCFDGNLHAVMLFGGRAEQIDEGDFFNDLWYWDATDWFQLSPDTSPSVRAYVAMAYHTAAAATILFGGHIDGPDTNYDDTWGFNGATWTELSPATVPGGGGGFTSTAMVYDAVNEVCVMVGVATSGDTSETWLYDGTDWSNADAPPPGVNEGISMAWDAANGNVVALVNASGVMQTWVWDGTAWTQQAPTSQPPARAFDSMNGGMAFHPLLGQVILFGGITPDYTGLFADTWAWSGAEWSQLFPAASAEAASTTLAGDLVGGTILSYGGYSGTGDPPALDDTWLLEETDIPGTGIPFVHVIFAID